MRIHCEPRARCGCAYMPWAYARASARSWGQPGAISRSYRQVGERGELHLHLHRPALVRAPTHLLLQGRCLLTPAPSLVKRMVHRRFHSSLDSPQPGMPHPHNEKVLNDKMLPGGDDIHVWDRIRYDPPPSKHFYLFTPSFSLSPNAPRI